LVQGTPGCWRLCMFGVCFSIVSSQEDSATKQENSHDKFGSKQLPIENRFTFRAMH
jgi:hypothetical protein